MDAILYTSNTGFTEQYAKLLGERCACPVYSLTEAPAKIADSAQIVYLGWLMASRVQGYEKAAKRYIVRAVCGVGMSASGTNVKEVREANAIGVDTPLFTLQGGFDRKKLRGAYRLMMAVMTKSLIKRITEKPDQTPEDKDTLDLLTNGGSRVSADALDAVAMWMGNAQ